MTLNLSCYFYLVWQNKPFELIFCKFSKVKTLGLVQKHGCIIFKH